MAGNHANRTWQSDLVARHPRLFHIPSRGPEAAKGYPSCEKGWQDLIERACSRIEAALAVDDSFETLQVKEKYATLRWYWTGHLSEAATAKVEEAIALAVARSACTCEQCGTEGRLFKRGGWYLTACDDHADGEPVAVKPGFENLHIQRRFEAGLPIVSCRRYDRAADQFVDVDPGTIGIE